MSPAYPINESRLVERADGSIVVNGRYAAGGTRYRVSAVSTDKGETWSNPVYDTETGAYVAIDSGFTMYSDGPDPLTDRLIFSRPNASNRSNMTVSVSYDNGYSYAYSRVANAGTSYYSDLATLSDGTIVMLYGKDGTSASVPQKIVLARFNMAWLTNGADDGRGVVPERQTTAELGTKLLLPSKLPWPTVVPDANARGGKLLDFTATAVGDHVDIPFLVTEKRVVRRESAVPSGCLDRCRAGFDRWNRGRAALRSHARHGNGVPQLSARATDAEGWDPYDPGQRDCGRMAGGWRITPDQLVMTQPR